jgi:hypothetical protein
MLLRTAKSCGPDAPTLASSLRMFCRPYRACTKLYSASDGGKRARSPGRARRKPLKPLRAGMPGDSGVLVVTRVLSTTTKCTRGRGCSGHPAFPTPFGREGNSNASGAPRREKEVVCGTLSTSLRASGAALQPFGNSTIASPVATFSSCWLRTMTSIRTQREFAVTCFDLTMPVGWIVSPGRTGLTQRVSRRR